MEDDQLRITETLRITPNPSPFSSNGNNEKQEDESIILSLSHLDYFHDLTLTFRTLRLYYPPTSPDFTYESFSSSLASSISKALSLYFPLAATSLSLSLPNSNSRLALKCSPSDSIPLTFAASALPVTSVLLHMDPGSPFLDRLAPKLAGSTGLLALQVTRFACGGIALGMCVHHSLCDGPGATKFLSAVTAFVRGEEKVRVEPVWERSELLGPRRPPRVEVRFGEVIEVSEGGPYGGADQGIGVVLRESFHVSDAGLSRFRSRIVEESGGVGFTAFEALGAFIWRARVKATALDSSEAVKFAYVMNVAKLVKPPLPAGYWGNACVTVYVKLTVGELLDQPLSKTAKLIKDSKNNVNDEYVRSYIDFKELHYEKGLTAGKFVSGFTDWRHLGQSDVDFGWGGPKLVLPLTTKILGSFEPTFFLPYVAGEDGKKKDGFKALVCLREKAMAAFRNEMDVFNC